MVLNLYLTTLPLIPFQKISLRVTGTKRLSMGHLIIPSERNWLQSSIKFMDMTDEENKNVPLLSHLENDEDENLLMLGS